MFNNKSNKGKRFIFLKAFKYLLIFVMDLCGSCRKPILIIFVRLPKIN